MSRKLSVARRSRMAGFSLIEVLVTMVITIVGLLGLGSLMLKGLQAGTSSQLRSIAVSQAYDMADRMRSNQAGEYAGNYDSIIPSGSSSSCSSLASAANPVVQPPTSTGSCTACSSSSCSVANVAARDACQWHLSNKTALPGGAGAVCKISGANAFVIYVSWDDAKTGSNNKTFTVRVEP